MRGICKEIFAIKCITMGVRKVAVVMVAEGRVLPEPTSTTRDRGFPSGEIKFGEVMTPPTARIHFL
jgi:hypothetical protein